MLVHKHTDNLIIFMMLVIGSFVRFNYLVSRLWSSWEKYIFVILSVSTAIVTLENTIIIYFRVCNFCIYISQSGLWDNDVNKSAPVKRNMFVMFSYWNNVYLWYFYQNHNFKGTSWKAEFLAENGMKRLLGMGIILKRKMIEKWGFWGLVCHAMVNKVNFLVRFNNWQ